MTTLTTLIEFNITDGVQPSGSLIADANGDLFGTTAGGGANGDGTVFEIAKTVNGYASTPTELASFNGTTGASPVGSLIADANGDLFGTTSSGGTNGDGTVFEIAKTTSGFASAPTVLVSFNSTDGADPSGSLIADAEGNLFGTTARGGVVNGYGTVFEIAKTVGGYASTPTVLVKFNGTDGEAPAGSLIADANGDLFGTTQFGGADNDGAVFEIAKTGSGYASTPTLLVSFDGDDGNKPSGSLIADAAGDLFGTTQFGGATGYGTVFEIAKTAGGYASMPAVLVSFNGTDGDTPSASLIADASGDLFGTTAGGGEYSSGTVFEITKTAGGYASTPTVLTSFISYNGYPVDPTASLIADASGDLFSTAKGGGENGYGSVFEISDSGVVICYLRGTKILTPTGEVNVETLQIGDDLITRFGGIRPIKWIGRQSFARRFVKNNREQFPVRIEAGALGNNLPKRDLSVSPGHSMLLNGQLVLAKSLVNGVNITQHHAPAEIHYYQIEFETHDCVQAEGAWSESYADSEGMRNKFHNAATFFALYPDYKSPAEPQLCAPRPLEGPELSDLLQPVASRAAAETAAGPLRGWVDAITADGVITGWAQDEANPELPVLLELLVENKVIHRFLACDYRGDLAQAGIGQGRCSFAFTAPVTISPETLHHVQIRRAADATPLPFSHELQAGRQAAA